MWTSNTPDGESDSPVRTVKHGWCGTLPHTRQYVGSHRLPTPHILELEVLDQTDTTTVVPSSGKRVRDVIQHPLVEILGVRTFLEVYLLFVIRGKVRVTENIYRWVSV